MILAFLILLLLASTFPSIPKAGATTTEDSRPVTYGLSEDVPTEPMPANFTADDYLNTTNPYADFVDPQGALDEVDDPEGSNPLYVLVFGDEEERSVTRFVGPEQQYPCSWDLWAELQLERGDEALVANFGIDIRILGFLEWDSDDSIEYMTDPDEWDLCDELLADKGHYLRTWYEGEWWSNYVDAIVGITAQATPETPWTIGVAPSTSELNHGAIFFLLKWQVYWKDDNLVQHEVSHLYYASDHPESEPTPCCAMANHPHYHSYIWEDGFWWVWDDDPCALTAYFWCTDCNQTIQGNSDRYPIRTLTISASSGGTTSPVPGTYTHDFGESFNVTALAYSNYYFVYWTLDGATKYGNPINLTMNSDHDLKAHFYHSNGGGGCPFICTWNGTSYVIDNNLLGDSAANGGADVEDYYRLEQSLVRTDGKYSLLIKEFEQEHSYLDQVKLMAVDHESDVNVAVSRSGEILTYKNPTTPISAVDNNGTSRLDEVSLIDGNISDPSTYFYGEYGDYVTLDFGNLDISNGAKLVFLGNVEKKPAEPGQGCIHVQVLNATTGWADLEVVRTRVTWSTLIVDLADYLPDANGDLKVRLYLTAIHRLDYVGLDTTKPDDFDLHHANMVSAIHSEEGRVKTELLASDDLYAELVPGQQIELAFTLPENSKDARTFITHVEGHYYIIG